MDIWRALYTGGRCISSASPNGTEAARIGSVSDGKAGQVSLRTRIGGQRLLGMLEGAQLPRIC